MQRPAVEDRDVEQQPGHAAPPAEHLGEDGGKRHRDRHLFRARPLDQPPVSGRLDPPGDAPERRPSDQFGLDGQGKLRGGGQFGETLGPVPPVTVDLVRAQGRQVGAVAGVRVRQWAQCCRAVPVGQREIIEEDVEAQYVGDEEVQFDVQPSRSAGEQRQLYVEDLAPLDRQPAVRQRLPDRGQVGCDDRRLAEVVHAQAGPRRPVPDLLGTVAEHPHPQHRVTLRHREDRLVQPVEVDAGTVHLEVHMAADATQRLVVTASHPVGVLDRAQLERRRDVDLDTVARVPDLGDAFGQQQPPFGDCGSLEELRVADGHP
ncbi:hypothetical protein GCM10029963_01770 [Micromonospora andamanensis]